MNVTEIREAQVAVCPTCNGALLPTPSGKFSCLKMCGPLKSLVNESSQKLALVLADECRAQDVGVRVDRKWADFVRSLPVAAKGKHRKKMCYVLDDKPHRVSRYVKCLGEVARNSVCAIVTPRTQARVAVLSPLLQEASK